MNTFTHGQKVLLNNEVFLFSAVSGRGGKGQYAFIQQFPCINYKMKQVKISDLKAA
jgi:hypothetical protein